MLRHIMSISLAITACATLIPTKVDAATLTVTPIGTLRKNPGDSITFIFSLNPAPILGSNSFKFQSLSYDYDGTELSRNRTIGFVEEPNTIVTNTQTIASITFDVLQPLKDGQSDLFDAYAIYQVGDEDTFTGPTPYATGSFDIEPVPEPLTIFGTATAFGCGILFKRKSSKKTVS